MIRPGFIVISMFLWCTVNAQSDDYEFMSAKKLYNAGLYDSTINYAVYAILKKEKAPDPRLYRLIGYSYKKLGQSAAAIRFLSAYLLNKKDSSGLLPVFSAMGEVYQSMHGEEDSAVVYFSKSIKLENAEDKKKLYYLKIIDLYQRKKEYRKVLFWNKINCISQKNPSNTDLINWGLAAYKAEDYYLSDSIFSAYRDQHPGEEFGYYWEAKNKAAIDSAMKMGLAVPMYKSLIDLSEKDSTINISMRHKLEALNYIAVYYLKIKRDPKTAKKYFEKALQLDPNNADARKYMHSIKYKTKLN